MDFTLYRLDAGGAQISLPHGSRSRFPTEAEAVARAEELRGEAAALGDTVLPAYAVVDAHGETVREIKDMTAAVSPTVPVSPSLLEALISAVEAAEYWIRVEAALPPEERGRVNPGAILRDLRAVLKAAGRDPESEG